MDKTRAGAILQILQNTTTVPVIVEAKKDPFKILIMTIISQNTSDANTQRAFEKLSKHFKITPPSLAKAQITEIENCLRVGGLYRNKAKTIQTVSKIIFENFDSSLNPILSQPFDEARKILLEFPGVGPKTADVVLLLSANQPTIPVDTHVNRVSKRLGLAPSDGGYEDVRFSLESFFDPKDYLAVHLLLIAHGRKYCNAIKPNCSRCQINSYCPSKILGDKT